MFSRSRIYLFQDYLKWIIIIIFGILFFKIINLNLATFLDIIAGDPAQKSLSFSILLWLIISLMIIYQGYFYFRQYVIFAKMADRSLNYTQISSAIIILLREKITILIIFSIAAILSFQYFTLSIFLVLVITSIVIFRNYLCQRRIEYLSRMIELSIKQEQKIKVKLMNFNTRQNLLLGTILWLILGDINFLKFILFMILSIGYFLSSRNFLLSHSLKRNYLEIEWNKNHLYLIGLGFFTFTLMLTLYFSDYLYGILNLIKKYT